MVDEENGSVLIATNRFFSSSDIDEDDPDFTLERLLVSLLTLSSGFISIGCIFSRTFCLFLGGYLVPIFRSAEYLVNFSSDLLLWAIVN